MKLFLILILRQVHTIWLIVRFWVWWLLRLNTVIFLFFWIIISLCSLQYDRCPFLCMGGWCRTNIGWELLGLNFRFIAWLTGPICEIILCLERSSLLKLRTKPTLSRCLPFRTSLQFTIHSPTLRSGSSVLQLLLSWEFHYFMDRVPRCGSGSQINHVSRCHELIIRIIRCCFLEYLWRFRSRFRCLRIRCLICSLIHTR